MNEIIFNDKGCYKDFGVVLDYFKPQPPTPKVIKEEVPYMNGSYDFSTVGTNGEVVFTDRKLLCGLQYKSRNKALMLLKYSELLDWLLSGWHELIYTAESDMKYIAQVEQAPSFELFQSKGGILQFEFTAEPFKIGVNLVNDQIPWDTFNFETDSLAPTSFSVSGSQTISVYNPGRAVVPKINVTANMTAKIGNYTTSLVFGDNTDYAFKLQPGDNSILVNGTGTISFIFRKVAI